jgi:hypothetical protein
VNNFSLNPETGLMCLNTGVDKRRLACDIVTSPYSYLDELGNVCYNMYVYASAQSTCDFYSPNSVFATTLYDPSDCSFNTFKVCVSDVNFYPPQFNRTLAKVTAVVTLDYVLKWEALCLYQFKLAYPKTSGGDFLYSISPVNNTNSSALFSVNATLDCLTFEVGGSCLERRAVLGRHVLDVMAADTCGRYDVQRVTVYVIESCRQKGLVTINYDSRTVIQNLDSYVS